VNRRMEQQAFGIANPNQSGNRFQWTDLY